MSCNFNYTDNKENDVNQIIWTDFQKLKMEITERRGDKTVIEIIEEIFKRNDMIEFNKNITNTQQRFSKNRG